MGQDPVPNSEWVNLHYVVRKSRDIKLSIREHGNVKYDKKRNQYSLEALEWEFGIERPVNLRSHSYRYRDLGGEFGLMEVLATAKQSIAGLATAEAEQSLRSYCEADVKNMYEIAYACEQLLFSRNQRRKRRQLNP